MIILSTRYAKVKTKQGKGKWHHQTIGLPQGSSISNIIYPIYNRL